MAEVLVNENEPLYTGDLDINDASKWSGLDDKVIDNLKNLHHSKGGKISKSDFDKLIKNRGISKDLFPHFDRDGNGTLSVEEFIWGFGTLLGKNENQTHRMLFGMLDTDKKGYLTREDVEKQIPAQAKNCNVQFSEDVTKALVDQVMDGCGGNIDLDKYGTYVAQKSGSTRNRDMFKRCDPELYAALFPPRETATKKKETKKPIKERLAYIVTQEWPRLFITFIFFLVCFILFVQAFLRYQLLVVAGQATQCVPIARGFGAILNFGAAIVVVPMWRITITNIRRLFPSLQKLFVLDAAIAFHKMIGYTVIFAGFGHTFAHWCNYSWTGTYLILGILSRPGLTGHIIFFSMLIIFMGTFEIFRRGKVHEMFHMTHWFWLLFLPLTIIHGPYFWLYILIPGGVFLMELMIRISFRFFVVEVQKGTQLPLGWERDKTARRSTALHLELKKPKYVTYLPGQYFFINSREISWYEWHPFSISSSPKEDVISFHIRRLGNWTAGFFDIFNKGGEHESRKILVRLDGPYGAPADKAFTYNYVMLIATGIGVTPMISILRHMFFSQVKSGASGSDITFKRVVLYWMNREQHAIRWFADLIRELEQVEVLKGILEFEIFMTGLPSADGRNALLTTSIDSYYKANGRDPITGLKAKTQAGRPRWDPIFTKNAERDPHIWGVFVTGHPALTAEIAAHCKSYSKSGGATFEFNEEVF